MKKFAIVARPDELSEMLEKEVEKKLINHQFVRDDEDPDTVIVLGGDGTFIYAVHKYLCKLKQICFFGLHTGTLGFYTDYRDDDICEFMDVLINHNEEGCEEKYPLLRVQVGDKKYYAMNEARIENAARTQKMDVYLNTQKFETFRGTGMCVCTQLGSTAYNRSLGGAVIQDGLDLIELTEISGIHHSKYRSLDAPFVLKANSIIEFRSDSFDGAVLGIDSDVYPLSGENKVEVALSQSWYIRVLRRKQVSYFERLKSLF